MDQILIFKHQSLILDIIWFFGKFGSCNSEVIVQLVFMALHNGVWVGHTYNDFIVHDVNVLDVEHVYNGHNIDYQLLRWFVKFVCGILSLCAKLCEFSLSGMASNRRLLRYVINNDGGGFHNVQANICENLKFIQIFIQSSVKQRSIF
jgi:hypothetical protein